MLRILYFLENQLIGGGEEVVNLVSAAFYSQEDS
jgi:hypothetical protein